MNSLYGFLRNHTPAVFNPRVMPDPTEAERLEAKLHEATQRLNERVDRARRAYHMPTQA